MAFRINVLTTQNNKSSLPCLALPCLALPCAYAVNNTTEIKYRTIKDTKKNND